MPISIWRGAEAVAASIDGAAFKCDVGQEKDIRHLIEETERRFGPIALFCSNAGIGGGFDPLSENAGGSSDEPWARSWAIHVMAHVYAARHLIPRMKARGGGLLSQYDFRRGSAVAGRKPGLFDHQACRGGICGKSCDLAQGRWHQVSILCPQGVDTNMLRSIPKGPQSGDGDLSPEQVAKDVAAGHWSRRRS